MADYISQFTGGEIDARLRKVSELEAEKQDALVSGENIKTVGGQSVLGSGDIPVGDENAVKFTPQTLTDAQKAQALANIGAASLADVANMDFVIVTSLPSASASTMGHIYLVGPDANDNYDRYVTKLDGGSYSWVTLGSTQIDLSDYATKAEMNELEAKVDDFNGAIVVSHLNLIENWDTSGARAISDPIPVKPNTQYAYFRGATPALTLPVAIIQYNANGEQILSEKVNTVTTNGQTAYVRIDDYKSVIGTSMFIEGTVAPARYVSYEDSKSIVTENEDFNEGIQQIVEDDVLPNYVVGGGKIKTDSIPIDTNDWLKVISNNIVDNTTNVAGKNINPTTGELQDYAYTNVSQFIGVIANIKYLILKGATAIAKYNDSYGYISQENVESKNYVTFGNDVAFIRVTLRYNEDAVIIASDDIINMSQSSLLQVRKHSSELYQNIADNLGGAGSKVIVGTKYNILTNLMQASLTNGIFRIATATGKYLSNKIFDKGTFTFATTSDYDLEHFEYSVVKYDEDDIFISKQDITGVASFDIGDEDCAYFRIFGNNRANCLVIGESADYGKKDAETYLVQFRNDDYREQILKDILRLPDAKKVLYSLLYPHLYGKKWAALGDSMTNGTGATPYVTVIGEMFNMNAINYGIIGSQIAQYSEGQTANDPMCVRYVDMDSDADIVTIMGGGNDSYDMLGTMADRQENGQYTFYSGCHRLLSGLCQKYAGKKIGVITSTQTCRNKSTDDQWGAPDINMEKRRAKAAALKQVAEFYGLPCFDLFNCEGFSGYSDDERALFWQSDKLHLTTFGQAFIADKIAKWLMTI